MKQTKRIMALTLALILALVLLTGCSSGKDDQKAEDGENASLKIAVATRYVDDEMLAGLKEELAKSTTGGTIDVTGIIMGDSESDPMTFMAGMTGLSARIAAKDIDILITDSDTARRVGENGETYLAINDTFTSSEIETFTSGLACVAIVNDEGELTDEVSAPCGVVLSDRVNEMIGLSNMQMFIVSNTTNQDDAKTVFQYLATLE